MAATDNGLTPQPGREAPQLAAGLPVVGTVRPGQAALGSPGPWQRGGAWVQQNLYKHVS